MDVIEVKLLIEYIDGRPNYESIPADRLAGGMFRILNSPMFAHGVARGDIIELLPDGSHRYRVTKRSGNVCIQVFLKSKATMEMRQRMAARFQTIGGCLDGGRDGKLRDQLVFTVHVDAGFDRIEALMDQLMDEFEIDAWYYGNIFRTDGFTPLGWWNEPPWGP